MAYKLRLIARITSITIKMAGDILKAVWKALLGHKTRQELPISGPIRLYALDDGIPKDITVQMEKLTKHIAENDLARPMWEFRAEDPHKKPPPPFRILEIDEADRRISYETLYPDLAEEKLGDFGAIQKLTSEVKEGFDSDGHVKTYEFFSACLSIAPNFDFARAKERAVGLENMDVQEAYTYALRIVEAQIEDLNKDYTNELFSSLQIVVMPEAHTIVVITALHEFPMHVNDKICFMAHSEAATEDGFLRRYYMQARPEVNLRFAAAYCYDVIKKIAKNIVTQGDTWDIWRER